ncbi:hypothetical protein XENTR_v10008357 [Xenopus tropicalis]|uniref:G protein-regulated inducer of neurite outgrowth 1 n=1 Tax=Xenopus tropicalis TaxID=8364 RepID=A0A803JRH3_XENTR|nr:G protein-regulated inducer of neurite outgrowth 1 [Xenopus tropicalis]XP_031754705.1 G protein-regulated inducer of neurite outgrowth 1 [Xenopus tropicalis]KAE8614936.1 hypothetical protein XENTR_v10008357 [Xenopus tropicalis]
MDSPKKPQRLQLSKPEDDNDNNLPEKRSPISSRIWQEEDPTCNPGFSGEDRSMRNFCIRLQSDHDFMEGSFSFDLDGDSILGAKRENFVEPLSRLPVQDPKHGETSINKESRHSDFNTIGTGDSEFQCKRSQECPNTTSVETTQKDNLLECKRECKTDEGKQHSLSTLISQQPNSDNDVTGEGHSSESLLIESKATKVPEQNLEQVSFYEKHLDLESSTCSVIHAESKEKNISQSSHEIHGIEPDTKETPKNVPGSESYSMEIKAIKEQVLPNTSSDNSKDLSLADKNSEEAVTKSFRQDTEAKTNHEKASLVSKEEGTSLNESNQNTNAIADQATHRSIAVSPIAPPEGNQSFTFQTATRIPEASNIQYRTVAVSPFVLGEGSSSFLFQSGTATNIQYKSVAVSPIVPSEGCSSFTFQRGIDTQESSKVQCRSIAVSPIVPPEGSSSFTFQSGLGTQENSNVQYRSVAVSPIAPPEGSTSFTFQSGMGTQENSNVQYRSVAVSPIVPPEGSTSFAFQSGMGTQEKLNVQHRSVAVSPIVPPDGSSSFIFQSGMGTQETSNVHYRSVAVSPIIPPEGNSSLFFQTGMGTQELSRVQHRSVAVSPFVPSDGSSSFTFQSEHNSQPAPNHTGSSNISKAYTFELAPPNQGVGAETRAECRSIAVSPIVPPDESTFTFQMQKIPSNMETGYHKDSLDLLPKTYSFELTPPNQDVGIQADTRAECVSVAVSPIIPPDASSSFIFQSDQKQQEWSCNENKPDYELLTPKNQESGSKAYTTVQYVSVAVSPIVPPEGSSTFSFISERAAADQSRSKEGQCVDNLSTTCSLELISPAQDNRVEYKSVAVSPIVPPEESSFTFQSENKKDDPCSITHGKDNFNKSCSFSFKPPTQDIGVQTDNISEFVSIAVSPFVFSQGPGTFTFQTEGKQQELSLKQQDQAKENKSCQIRDFGTQTDNTVQCTSIAVSPFIPAEGSSFQFQTESPCQSFLNTACSHVLEKPVMKDAEMQVSFSAEMKSVATDPMTPIRKSPQTSYPEVQVKAKGDHPEPVREVSWDEKGMTWEVYGASMEVEVLGMAIQKHLEKQIEEHGRQKVMTPQNTRGSSVRGASVRSEGKRQPGTFRTFFHRRPRCCSGAGPAVE